MRYSRKIGPPIVSAAVATLVLTNFATVSIIKDNTNSQVELFGSIWPIALTSAVAVILVMSFLYKSLVDLVDELEAREANAQHQALHDQLTGLANRALLEDRLSQALTRYRRSGEQVALLMLDLDRFKQVNDTLGHNAGDKLVQEVGERLRSLLRETDTVARIGGDEFAIVQVSPKGEADVRRLCDRIISVIRKPFMIGDREARVGVSIGAVFATKEVSEASELLRKADITMYRAKAAGRDCFRLFTEAMDADVQRRDQIESTLRAELSEGRGLDLHYQPIFDGRGKVTALEGLVRWDHPTLGQVNPSEIIPIAEECGVIDELGQHSFREACRMARHWPGLTIAVNLSAVQFRAPRFAASLRAIAAEEGVEPTQLELEITEGLFIEHGTLCGTTHPGAASRWLPHRARRFRHRLFLALLPAQIPGGQDQAGPLVHRYGCARPERRDHPRRGDARPCHGSGSRCRGHCQPRGRADRARGRLRRPAGAPLRARHACRGHRHLPFGA